MATPHLDLAAGSHNFSAAATYVGIRSEDNYTGCIFRLKLPKEAPDFAQYGLTVEACRHPCVVLGLITNRSATVVQKFRIFTLTSFSNKSNAEAQAHAAQYQRFIPIRPNRDSPLSTPSYLELESGARLSRNSWIDSTRRYDVPLSMLKKYDDSMPMPFFRLTEKSIRKMLVVFPLPSLPKERATKMISPPPLILPMEFPSIALDGQTAADFQPLLGTQQGPQTTPETRVDRMPPAHSSDVDIEASHLSQSSVEILPPDSESSLWDDYVSIRQSLPRCRIPPRESRITQRLFQRAGKVCAVICILALGAFVVGSISYAAYLALRSISHFFQRIYQNTAHGLNGKVGAIVGSLTVPKAISHRIGWWIVTGREML